MQVRNENIVYRIMIVLVGSFYQCLIYKNEFKNNSNIDTCFLVNNLIVILKKVLM